MSVSRIILPNEYLVDGGTLALPTEHAHYIRNVLRLKAHTHLHLVDAAKRVWQAELTSITSSTVIVSIQREVSDMEVVEPRLKIHLFQSMPKGQRMDGIIRQCVELGVYKITPVVAERCVSIVNGGRLLNRLQRWRRIAAEAVRQCGRIHSDIVTEPYLLKELDFHGLDLTHRYLFWERASVEPISGKSVDAGDTVGVIVGPEGGFTEDEVEHLTQIGFSPLSLGHRILRTETAPLAIISILLYLSGDIPAIE